MPVGGLVLLGSFAIDYMANFWTYIGAQGAGFALILAGSILTGATFRTGAARLLIVASTIVWFVCWSWFLTFGLFIPIPLVFWAALASLGYLVSVFALAIKSEFLTAIVPALLALGSWTSTGVMAMNPVFAADYTYAPFAIGALGAGIVSTTLAYQRSKLNQRGPMSAGLP